MRLAAPRAAVARCFNHFAARAVQDEIAQMQDLTEYIDTEYSSTFERMAATRGMIDETLHDVANIGTPACANTPARGSARCRDVPCATEQRQTESG